MPNTSYRRGRTARTARLAVAVLLAVVVAACGGDDDSGDPSGSADSGAEGAGGEGFPVTIEHAFGETVVEGAPERVVTVGWGSADAAIALGVVPVAIPAEEYGGDSEGVLPWIREALDDQGADTPRMIPEDEGPATEAIAAADPDLILAPYSGITEAQYEVLSQIAPTVAYPEEAWSTPWRDVVRIVGDALGRPDEAEELLAGIDAEVAAAADAHPELAGRSVALVWNTPDTFYVYKPADPRVQFTEDLGLTSAESVDELATAEGETFYYELSLERVDELTSDILVSYADTQEESDAFLGSDAARLMDQVQAGTVAPVVGTDLIAAVSPPTALSLTWGLDEYVAALSTAALAADGA